ncbi:ubiquitin-protein ligase [Scheffersomyces xylosifermentans]|uniref:ubiquitin-protein ligase n=1 Tax=Scheffersomyces xylosifermentans TaxID=1304137 RepID=UPI00315CB181
MDATETLRRFLLHLPAESNFNFSSEVRTQIRKAVFLSLSNNGKYLNWLFPNAFPNCEEHSPESMIASVDSNFNWLFANYYKLNLKKRDPKHDTHNHHAFHANSPCARIFRKGEPIYRCLTCGFDDTCALCSHCFQPEYHPGHKVHITICQRENGGVCDCGDPEAWVKEYMCPYAASDDASNTIRNQKMPEDLEECFLRTIEILLDYVIDVMSQSDSQFDDPEEGTDAKVELNTINSTLDPQKYHSNSENFVDANNDKYFLMVYNDQIRHYRDAVQRIHLASMKVKQFAVMVTEKVQNYGKAKVISSKNIKLLLERQKILSATGLATAIRSHRDVFREDMCDEILIWINHLTESEMFKINNSAKNLFCRAFCGKWNNGLLISSKSDDFYQYRVGSLDSSLRIPKIPSTKGDRKSQQHWFFKPSKWNLPDELCRECDYNLTEDDYEPHSSHLGSRLQYLIYLDVRFWKSVRIYLHDMYSTSLITNLCYKNIISCQYVDIYPTIADMFLTMDREPELNIMCTLSTQLFTCPSNSTSIVQHGDISRIFASIYGFLTVEEIRSPECVEVSHEISMKSLKNRRWGQIFFDIGYILSRSRDSKYILTSNIIPMACDILALFQGRPVMKREKKNHVEYESPDYTAFFHAISVIYQFGEYISHCLSNLGDVDPILKKTLSKNAIKYVIGFLLKLENNDYPGLLDEYVDISLSSDKRISKEPIGGNIIQHYRIDEEKVSFLHPIHSFLSWLIELSDFQSPSEIVEVLDSSTDFGGASHVIDIPNPLTSIFDYPIRTIVLMSQIKSGFWVRNGFSVRSQLQLYRNTGLRESGYMRDLFLTQVFINSNSPNLVCFLLFSRWLLMDGWLNEAKHNEVTDLELQVSADQTSLCYDSKTLPYMLEECMNFFVHVLTEDLYLRGLKDEVVKHIRIKKEIIHNLCFGPMSYTKLCSQIPDHIASEKQFDLILTEMTTFTAPQGASDIGVYHLKEEYYDEINPYYFNYTTNTKDDAIKFVKERTHKKTRKPITEIVIEPKLRDSSELGIYRYIGNFSASAYFSDFLIRTLTYIRKEGIGEVESLLETALHLIHICSFESAIDISQYGSFYDRFVNISDAYGTSIAVLLYDILTRDEFKSQHVKICCILKVFEDKYGSLGKILRDQVDGFDPNKIEFNTEPNNDESEFESKKKMAQERQAKLIAKFKKQQSMFLKKNNFERSYGSDIEMEDYEDEAGWKFPEAHCLLCQNAAEDAGPFGIITYISKSSEFRTVPFNDRFWFLKAFSDNANADVDEHEHDPEMLHDEIKTEKWRAYMHRIKEANVIGPGFSQHDHVDSKLVSSSCGHGMHFQCYMNYLNNNKGRSNQITRNSPENVERKEFLCPLCKAINNMFIPIFWTSNKRSLSQFLAPSLNTSNPFEHINPKIVNQEEWYRKFISDSDIDFEEQCILTPAAREMLSSSAVADVNSSSHSFRVLLSSMFQILSLLTFPQVFKADTVFILVNTIKSIEISLRGTSAGKQLVINQLSNNALINLRTLNEFRNSCVLMKVKNWIHTPNPRGDAYAKILAHIFSLSNDAINATIIEADFFELLVNIHPLPKSGYDFNTILKTCFLGQLIQNFNILAKEIVTHDFYRGQDYSILDVPEIAGVSLRTSNAARLAFKKITESEVDMIVNDEEFGTVIYSMLVKAVTPFLRRAAIFAFIQCANVEHIDFAAIAEVGTEADRLCAFLNIKSVAEHLDLFVSTDSSYEGNVFSGFVNYSKTSKQSVELIETRKGLEYPGLVKLTELPERLDYFFTKYYYSDKYNNPHMSIEDPAICLFCGTVIDTQKPAIGCKEGQCTTHYLKECANDVGIFLLPKERSLLLLHKNGGSFYNGPFLDQHGELPGESKKMKTLYLMKARYDEFIRNVWLQHNVQNIIVRNLDSVLDAGGWDTL